MAAPKKQQFASLDSSNISDLIPVTFNGVSYVSVSWEQMGQYTFILAKKILDSDTPKFDRVIAIAKGAWTWTRALVDYLDIDSIDSIRIQSYSDINSKSAPKITQPLTDSIVGLNVLLFDEVIDTGHTTKASIQYLMDQGANSVKLATLCYKPQSIVVPDYYAFQTTAWVPFPHEMREFITLSSMSWKAKGVSDEEIVQRFFTIGLPSDQVHYFMNLISKSK